MRLIDADELNKVKFHELPYTHIVPADLLKLQTEAYERGWNDAIDAIMESADTIDAEPVRHGKWLHPGEDDEDYHTVSCSCSVCGWKFNLYEDDIDGAPYCPMCGAKMEPVAPWYQVEGGRQ